MRMRERKRERGTQGEGEGRGEREGGGGEGMYIISACRTFIHLSLLYCLFVEVCD